MENIIKKRNCFLKNYFANYRDLQIQIVFEALPIFYFGEDRYVLEWRSVTGNKVYQLNDFGFSNNDINKKGIIINYFIEDLVTLDGTQLTLFVNDAELMVDKIIKSIEMFFCNDMDGLKKYLFTNKY